MVDSASSLLVAPVDMVGDGLGGQLMLVYVVWVCGGEVGVDGELWLPTGMGWFILGELRKMIVKDCR